MIGLIKAIRNKIRANKQASKQAELIALSIQLYFINLNEEVKNETVPCKHKEEQ